jgi:hypothetical protein
MALKGSSIEFLEDVLHLYLHFIVLDVCFKSLKLIIIFINSRNKEEEE